MSTSIPGIAERVTTLEQDVEAVTERDEERTRLREETAEHADRLDETERETTFLRRELNDAVDELEDAFPHNREQITDLREVARQQLSKEIQQETAEIDDIRSLKDILSQVLQTRGHEGSIED